MTSEKAGTGRVEPARLPERAEERPRERLLVIDDDGIVREGLRVALESRYEVACLHDGADAVPTIERFHPRLVLLDVNIPGGDGYGVCEAIREHARFRLLPILFMSARGDDASFLRGLEAGGDSYIVKPFEIAALRDKIQEMLRSHPRP